MLNFIFEYFVLLYELLNFMMFEQILILFDTAWNQRGKLMMEMPSFHKPEVIPPLSQSERDSKATYICNAIKRFSSLIPKGKPVQSVILQPEISTVFLQVVNNLRMCDLVTLSGVFAKCADEDSRFVNSVCLCLF